MANETASEVVEETSTRNQKFTVGELASASIQKHFHKSIKHKEEIFADKDPEPLHQMRVGMRRLRTSLMMFAPFVSLSVEQERDITKISKSLGNVRDLDVLGIWLQAFISNSELNEAESKQVEKALQCLNRRREKQFKQMCRTLRGKRYGQFVEEFQEWLTNPRFQAGADWPIHLVLPDLLLPLISQLLLHPGWLAAIADPIEEWSPNRAISENQIEIHLAEYGTVLHDLRKQSKQVRYQTELFKDFYDSAYTEQTLEFGTIQDILGQLQDSRVFSDFLTLEVGSQWKKAMPTLANYMQKQHVELWQQWQTIQQKYLNAEFRDTLRLLILRPL